MGWFTPSMILSFLWEVKEEDRHSSSSSSSSMPLINIIKGMQTRSHFT